MDHCTPIIPGHKVTRGREGRKGKSYECNLCRLLNMLRIRGFSCNRVFGHYGRGPFEYFKWVFGKLPTMTNQDDSAPLLPSSWAAAQEAAEKDAAADRAALAA